MTVPVVDAGSYAIYSGAGVSDNDLLFTTQEMSNYDTHELVGATGAVDVEVLLNEGGTWITAPASLEDLGAAAATIVVVTAALRLYRFRGNFHQIRVRQAGATAAAYVMRSFSSGR